jgi:flagellar secretion chaperone FliS
MTSPALRSRYLDDSVKTASPGRLLVMLYERLVLDLTRAETLLGTGEREAASAQLLHAQDIVIELRTSLDMDVWDGAAGLAQIYTYLISELIQANVTADGARVASCRGLVEPLLDAWRQAALAAVETAASRAV